MHFRAFGLVCCLTLSSFGARCAYTPDQVKAVYLFRIANFIYWNNEQQMHSVDFCLPDNPEIKQILQSIVSGQTIRNLPLQIRENHCDIVFISHKENLHYVSSASAHTVTIGDLERFTRYGGVIELYKEGGRIKPRINIDNIGDYTISSNLLRLAKIEGGQ